MGNTVKGGSEDTKVAPINLSVLEKFYVTGTTLIVSPDGVSLVVDDVGVGFVNPVDAPQPISLVERGGAAGNVVHHSLVPCREIYSGARMRDFLGNLASHAPGMPDINELVAAAN
nr:hypothetical protein EUGRSUZ_G01288 [Ipomoea batatas]GMC85486.1 hypothetical protein EUGRSUZ_G01288 [Ipomoea batatas]